MSLGKRKEGLDKRDNNWLNKDNKSNDRKNLNPNESWKYWIILLEILAEYKVLGLIKGKLNRAFFEDISCMMVYKSNKSDI